MTSLVNRWTGTRREGPAGCHCHQQVAFPVCRCLILSMFASLLLQDIRPNYYL